MRCRYVREIYRNEVNDYCVFIYQTEDSSVPLAARVSRNKEGEILFRAVGNGLLQIDEIEVELYGKWCKNKHGIQLAVETFDQILPQTIEGIKGYLASGMIKGIGPRTAELITDRFGVRTFEVLEKEPDKLLQIKGITEKKLKAILFSYRESYALRDLAAYLKPYKITDRKIQRIYEEFGRDSLNTVKNRPFSLCGISGFGFLNVDEIARANQCLLNDPMRIEGCVTYCMDLVMKDGHLYQEKEQFTDMVYHQLNAEFSAEVVQEREVNTVIYHMTQDGRLVVEQGAIYPLYNYRNETETAEIIAQILIDEEQKAVEEKELDRLITEAQKELGILLSQRQKEAVKMVFLNLLSIISGGPGTGKTTVEKVLLYVYHKTGGRNALLMAPTGRASRRMAESTGDVSACTMHNGLGLLGDDEDFEPERMDLEADFIILDEQSMVDMRLAAAFYRHIRKGTRIVLVGDVNQLPSVGPGNVFRELVLCGIVPLTVLDMVFRQGKNSRIASNAKLIQENNAMLEYGTDFVFLPAASDKEASEIVRKIYLEAAEQEGIEKVQILTPYRKRGAVSVNALNEQLREKINPVEIGKAQMKAGGKVFRTGDKIIQNKNKDGISNGDIGFIREIYLDEDGMEKAELEFGDGRIAEYGMEEMEMIDHSYATTIHKSQGSEYPIVIIPWIPMFYKMLKRNILYTGITRAQIQVYIVGSKRSIVQAVHSPQAVNRNTRLGERVIERFYQLKNSKKQDVEYEQIAMNF
ncbi:AAA family ATPase [Eisenbergiella tayi]|uniref:SF1B family DNA helicase RecD2 n=1 Tax=Eisenbergiella tayi TaxID=1432052 RepID=UPI00084891DD|nr:AAA family ATPase [Eisenbergiella tayi]ODR33733.1 hypothetical protein BEI60_22765 [Eisenbergiella tayi]